MQSGYGGVSEIPQFMVESCGGPSLFSISSPNPAAAAASTADLKYHPIPHPHSHHHHHHHHHQTQPPPPSPLQPHFTHFHSIPITQQLFQQPHHQFHQLFHPHPPPQAPPPQLELRRMIPPHHLGLDQESGPETSASPTRMITGGGGAGGGGGGGPSFLAAAMNFKLAMNESSGGGSREAINDDDGILQGDDGSESRLHPWQREDESAIKEPSWRPLDIDFINRNNKRYKDKEPAEVSTSKYCKKSKDIAEFDDGHAGGGGNYKPFSELEAIYKPGGSTSCGGGGGGGPNQTGSGSALTADEPPVVHAAATTAPGLPAAAVHQVGGSETSAGEEAPLKKFSKNSSRRRKKRRQQQQQLSSVAAFFENLVKQLMDHQESLHRKFLEVIEKRDQERTSREEAWRKQEAAKSSREAAARAHERALASSREAVIIAFLEKITGESLDLPSKPQFPFPDIGPQEEDNNNDSNNLQIIDPSSEGLNTGDGYNNNNNHNKGVFNSSRWPKAEVQALIRVRSGLESRFQEPGLKGPLWEEVSSTMAALGYHRNAKRCKEKWENINKYFRKAKESGKKRPQHSKTCPYFQQLDQLYAKSFNNKLALSTSSAGAVASGAGKDQRKDNSELLDAIVESTDHGSLKFSDTSSVRFDLSTGKDLNEATDTGIAGAEGPLDLHGNEEHNNVEDGEEEDELNAGTGDEEGEEEGEGESQDHEGPHGQQYQLQQQKEEDLHESNLYFQRLQS